MFGQVFIFKNSDPCDLTTVHADAVLKGTTLDGVYNCHPRNNGGSSFEHISFRELVSRGFTAMDMAALNFCEENNIPGMSMLYFLFLSYPYPLIIPYYFAHLCY